MFLSKSIFSNFSISFPISLYLQLEGIAGYWSTFPAQRQTLDQLEGIAGYWSTFPTRRQTLDQLEDIAGYWSTFPARRQTFDQLEENGPEETVSREVG